MTSVATRHEEQVQRLAADAFKDHRIKGIYRHPEYPEEPFGHWTCGKPDGSSIYRFNVTLVPWRLIITGDLGCLVVEHNANRDMIPWCRRSVHSTAYFAEKVVSTRGVKEYCPDVAVETVNGIIEDLDKDDDDFRTQRRKLRDIINWTSDDDESHVIEKLDDAGVSDPWEYNFRNWTSRFLWQRECVRWFVENLKE